MGAEGTAESLLVSIITPTFNAVDWLPRCRASIAAQTYPHIEHIIIDGGSTDGTVQLLEGYDDVKWVSESDAGQASAINKGFALASGTYVGWLNADDQLFPDAIERTVTALEQSPSAGFAVGRVEIRERGGGFVRKPAPAERAISWAAQNLAAQPGCLFRAASVEACGGLDERLHYMMDLDIWVRLLDRGSSMAVVPALVAIFELHDDSKSGSISHSEFVVEEALVRLRSGRSRSGAVAVGRAAAIRMWEGRNLESRNVAVNRLVHDERLREFHLDPELAEAGFRAESLLLGIKNRDLTWIRQGFGAWIWRQPEARARLVSSLGRGWARLRYRALQR